MTSRRGSIDRGTKRIWTDGKRNLHLLGFEMTRTPSGGHAAPPEKIPKYTFAASECLSAIKSRGDRTRPDRLDLFPLMLDQLPDETSQSPVLRRPNQILRQHLQAKPGRFQIISQPGDPRNIVWYRDHRDPQAGENRKVTGRREIRAHEATSSNLQLYPEQGVHDLDSYRPTRSRLGGQLIPPGPIGPDPVTIDGGDCILSKPGQNLRYQFIDASGTRLPGLLCRWGDSYLATLHKIRKT